MVAQNQWRWLLAVLASLVFVDTFPLPLHIYRDYSALAL